MNDASFLSPASAVVIGAGLAGSEAGLQLAARGVNVHLVEMRPRHQTPVHKTGLCAELVCSNSFKSTKETSAAGMLKAELSALGSFLYSTALSTKVAAGGALAVDRSAFAEALTSQVKQHPNIVYETREVCDLAEECKRADAVILATGPLTSGALASSIKGITGTDELAFYDAAAPIVMASSLDMQKLFCQSRYDETSQGDYINAPFTREQYEAFIKELISAKRVIAKSFETKDLFQACQPIEEIARKGADALRYGTLKPVGLRDPNTNARPYAALQLRAEDAHAQSFNLVGCQTNLTFAEQARVFKMVPGLENAEFARFGVMHRNTFLNAPCVLDENLRLINFKGEVPVFVAGQLTGTEGYMEAVRSGLHAALSCAAHLQGISAPKLPNETAFGALLAYSTSPQTKNYQPMHVNFGIMPPLEVRIRNKAQRYEVYAKRGGQAMANYCSKLKERRLL